jgi:5-methyltetrahydrofolate--homocysteine methyltransferase
MIIIGEKINGAIPSVKKAIVDHNVEWIRNLAVTQAAAGAHFIDCAPSTATEIEYETMVWMLETIQSATDTPVCIDSPDALLLKRILEEGHVKKTGMVNSVNEEGSKCETIFPLISNTDWHVVGLTCDKDGIPAEAGKKIDIAKSIIDKADKHGVKLANLHIDPCVMALSTRASSMKDFEDCIAGILAYAPEVNVTGAISNISFEMPSRKLINSLCMAYAIRAGLSSAICDPCNMDMMGTIYAAEALCMIDKGGRKYNRACRQGKFGVKKAVSALHTTREEERL